MDQHDYDNAVTIGFIFGTRLMEVLYGLEQSPSALAKQMDLVRQVADGESTLGRTPAELRLHYPNLDPDKLEQHHRRNIEQNRQQAQAILRVHAKRPAQ